MASPSSLGRPTTPERTTSRRSPVRAAIAVIAGRPHWQQFVALTFGVTIVEFVFVALNVAYEGSVAAPPPLHLFPAIGFTIGVMTLSPRRLWGASILGGVFIGAGLVPFVTDAAPLDVLPVAAGAIVQSLIVAGGLEWLTGRPPSIRRPSQAAFFLGLTLIASLAGATVMMSLDWLGVRAIHPDLDLSWESWFAGEFVGTAVAVPVALSFRVRSARLHDWSGRLEAAGLCGLMGLAVVLSQTVSFAFCYFTAPLVLWMALRFGARFGAPAAAVTIINVIALSGRGIGPFAGSDTWGHGVFGIAMAMTATAVLLLSLTEQAADDRYHLSATLEAIPDTVVLTGPEGGIIDVWGPRDAPLPRSSLRAHLEAARRAGGGRRRTVEGARTFDHSWTTAGNGRQLHLIRDVSVEASLDEERRRKREEVELARLAEQRRIGVELHDGPIQELAATLLRLGQVLDVDDPSSEVELLERQLTSTIGHLRSAANRLIPPDVSAGAVGDGLRDFAERVFSPGTVCSVDDHRWESRSAGESDVLFLVGREALANAAFHANPTRVEVGLTSLPGRAILSVADDGPGFAHTAGDRRHLGLQIMRERLGELGGELSLEGSRWGGLLVVASVPRRRDDDAVVDVRDRAAARQLAPDRRDGRRHA